MCKHSNIYLFQMNEEDRGDKIQVSLIARRINSYKQIKITSKNH